MASRRTLERRLSSLDGFDHPRVDLEQYPTPPAVAASIVHVADLRGDLHNRTVIDLGCGTGVLTVGVALRNPSMVTGLEIDPSALRVAMENAGRLELPVSIQWMRGDVLNAPLSTSEATVVMNPPFGAQRGNVHADRAFLSVASGLASVSYSIHNAGSESFVRAFVADVGGRVTDAWEVSFDLARQYDFHEEAETTVEAEAYRIRWR